jgi:hypothetical protein
LAFQLRRPIVSGLKRFCTNCNLASFAQAQKNIEKIPTPMNLSYPACRKRLAVKIIRVSRMALTVSGFGKYGSSTPVPSFMPSPCLSQQAAKNEHRQKSASHTYRNPPQL